MSVYTTVLQILTVSILAQAEVPPIRVDVFVESGVEIYGISELEARVPRVMITIRAIDGVATLATWLSTDLPHDPDLAKRLALQRLRAITVSQRDTVQDSVDALVLARRHGVRRYPAVLFDTRAVVYGVTDLAEAYARYLKWQERLGQ